MKAISSQQLMRSFFDPCFEVSIQYGASIKVKVFSLHKAFISKAYIALFVYMVIKAIHFELLFPLNLNFFNDIK